VRRGSAPRCSGAWVADARRRLGLLSEQVEAEPKSTKWRVGDRVRWYEEPEEK
jgi:hypothetical protein